jgi:proteasome lid subunit RPN8/RPN11
VDILVSEPAFRNAQAHAISSLSREVAGVLVGPPPEKQPDGRYVVHVSDTIVAKHTRMQGASVTYTPESWRYVTDKLQELYPDDSAVMVGWYHSHPGFGIFLSGMDQFIHQNFFTQIWHVALVLDPLGLKSGFFCWDRLKSHVSEYEFPWPKWAQKSW